ncbi:hypothetical protein H4R34_000799 [Dimargaris verticillata]|uniref:Histidine phosphatase superfamily n=1 Tax=Dimargaris verticillata TaxID=2761393 RepID=A0A9W8B4R5_9FUNG|nr:hypothetical protein H4R34_000799 [Dimargaris verticillata]
MVCCSTAKAGARLKFVQVFVRHGDRTPLSFAPLHPTHWSCGPRHQFYCQGDGTHLVEREDRVTLPDDTILFQLMHYAPTETPFNKPMLTGTCAPGQLTNKGMEQHHRVGRALRAIYVDQLQFLPQKLTRRQRAMGSLAELAAAPYNMGQGQPLFVRSTPVSRTQVSAQNLVDELYPKDHREKGYVLNHFVYPEEADTFNVEDERCPRLLALIHQAQASTAYRQHQQAQQALRDQYNRILGTQELPGYAEAFHHYGDLVTTQLCHRRPLQCHPDHGCVTPGMAAHAIRNSGWEYDYLYRDSPEAAEIVRLKVGWLMRDLYPRWLQMARQPRASRLHGSYDYSYGSPIFELYSGHDSTLAPLLGLLGQTDLAWPPYASQVLFEFWQATNDAQQTYVRVLYNGNVLPSTRCDFSRCPLGQFLQLMEEYLPHNATECQA